MTKFEVHILGCGSAVPTTLHNPSAQLVEVNNKLFMIDCGEGAQLQMRRQKARINNIHSIFISHLHGDHVFGLPGLISTMGLIGRKGDLDIYAHKEIEIFLNPILEFFCQQLSFKVNVKYITSDKPNVIFENKTIKITSFPLHHRIPTCGFLFEEKEGSRHIRRDMIEMYNVPVFKINSIKAGSDYITEDGQMIANNRLTTAPDPVRKYAYCSDTKPNQSYVPTIEGVDLLYHEATFATSEIERAKATFHSTARQAAEIATAAKVKRLVIGHYSARYYDYNKLLEEAKNVFPNTEAASEGKIFSL